MTTIAASHAKPGTSSGRVYNFSAGPGVLPDEVLHQIQEEVWNCRNSGVGILEHSHRGPVYDSIVAEIDRDFREVGSIPKNYHVLFMTGGSTSQNFIVPMNFMPADRSGTADYCNTGYWANQSIEHARIFGTIHEAASSKPDGYAYIPTAQQTRYSARPSYVHYTSNNTIYGTQYHSVPTPPVGAPLVCDMCSDIFSRPFDVNRYGLIYASAQKNLGPAGTTVVIVRDDLVEKARVDIPVMLQYRTFAKGESRPNTPPVFPIYCVGLMVKWIKSRGGLAHFEKYNAEKAKIVYDLIVPADSSRNGFYRGHAREGSRSLMNITFRCPTPRLDDLFATEAERSGLDCIRGHRVTGGMRASTYNAMPREGCLALAQFMREFERTHG
jgi:phosphoserine aminotransferase